MEVVKSTTSEVKVLVIDDIDLEVRRGDNVFSILRNYMKLNGIQGLALSASTISEENELTKNELLEIARMEIVELEVVIGRSAKVSKTKPIQTLFGSATPLSRTLKGLNINDHVFHSGDFEIVAKLNLTNFGMNTCSPRITPLREITPSTNLAKHLKSMWLAGNYPMDDRHIRALSHIKLTTLELGDRNARLVCLLPLDSNMAKHLRTLYLENATIGSEFVASLQSLGLARLVIDKGTITNEGTSLIAEILTTKRLLGKKLKQLEFHGHTLTDKDLVAVFSLTLKNLILKDCRLPSNIAALIENSVLLKNVRYIDMRGVVVPCGPESTWSNLKRI